METLKRLNFLIREAINLPKKSQEKLKKVDISDLKEKSKLINITRLKLDLKLKK